MRRDTLKLLIFAGIVGFAVMYGMELSSKGIENINGPWETTNPTAVEQSTAEEGDWTLPAGHYENPDKIPSDADNWNNNEELSIPRYDREPIVDRVSGKTAEVLHDLSRNGIRMVVSIFDKVMG
ncbi:hypothetical protein [Cohnella sp. WQ 127256]|uniref:hypothetical protein n=1 Tax=Cohnella sp. WQ 127256 TaxID=2938790 RepID=UPI00211853F2|nr:hypothetical protein [Cohnella sp. WQ 127256]